MTEAKRTSRIGLFGGTFNPIHLGHLRAAEEVREMLGLEQVLFIPSAVPPHKQSDPVDPIAPTETRLAWVEAALADHSSFSVDRIEVDRPGPSYLVDTLSEIREREKGVRSTVFIVGTDAFAEMGDWREPEALFSLTDLAVMTRPPGQLSDLRKRIPKVVRDHFEFSHNGTRALHKKAGTAIDLIPISALDISSSKIRERCRTNRSIRYLVPESIRKTIEAQGSYAPRSAAAVSEPVSETPLLTE